MRVAVLLPNWVGDTCMATPALRALAQMPSVQELVLVGKPGPLSVLEGLPYASHSITYKPRSRSNTVLSRRGAAAELRSLQLDAIVLLPNSLSTGVMAWLSRIPRRIGFAKNGRGMLLTDPVPIRSSASPSDARATPTASKQIDWSRQPAIDYYLHLVKRLGAEGTDKRMELAVRESDRTEAEQLLARLGLDRSRPWVLVNNASGSSPARLWPSEHAVRFARRLAEGGRQVLFHAGPADRLDSLSYATRANHPLVRSMGEATDLPIGLSKGLISLADLVVTTDSGPRHIAVALNKRVVSLFGPTSQELTQTYNVPEIKIETQQSCRPCGEDVCPLKHQRCLADLSPERLYEAVHRLLTSPKAAVAHESKTDVSLSQPEATSAPPRAA